MKKAIQDNTFFITWKQLKAIIVCLFLLLGFCNSSFATIWQVGPTKSYTFCSQVANLVQNGDTVEIDFATYINDAQVTWSKNNLYIIGVGGRPRLEAGTIIATDTVNGKGIFVIAGDNIKVENVEFANAMVNDHNGAGIRQEGANLWVHSCKFIDNEMGILQGGYIPNCKTIVEYSEFSNGGSIANPGYQHNIYINHIDTFIFRYNFSYNAIAEGHELKSRARNNFILYNTISNYQSMDSRNIDFPNGGICVLMGNIIEQGLNSVNSNILGYGHEGLTNSGWHELYIVNNTFINKKSSGSFIDVSTNMNLLFMKNNLFAGAKTAGLILGSALVIDSSNNIADDNISVFNFSNPTNNNYQLLASSPAVNAGIAINNSVGGILLSPDKIYQDTCNYDMRLNNNNIDLGAYELKFPNAIFENNINENSFEIYPNPSRDFLIINVENIYETLDLVIYNMLGNPIKAFTISSVSQIDISDLDNGSYFIVNRNAKGNARLFKKIQ